MLKKKQKYFETKLFKNEKEFINYFNNWNKKLPIFNGCTKQFLAKHNLTLEEYSKMNATNQHCWNCLNCKNCDTCYSCIDCNKCSNTNKSLKCYKCKELTNCDRCFNSKFYKNSSKLNSKVGSPIF